MSRKPSRPEEILYVGKVSREWQTQGVWLNHAARAFSNPDELRAMDEAAEAFALLREGETPDDFQSNLGLPGVELRFRLLEFLPEEEQRPWRLYHAKRSALRLELKAKLNSGHLLAYGDPNYPGADPQWIPTRTWFHLRQPIENENVVRGEGIAFFFVRVVKPSSTLSDKVTAAYRTGAPGRPGSLHLVTSEFERRLATGELIQGSEPFIKVAEVLAAWVKGAHPEVAPVGTKTIQNSLGRRWMTIPKRNAKG